MTKTLEQIEQILDKEGLRNKITNPDLIRYERLFEDFPMKGTEGWPLTVEEALILDLIGDYVKPYTILDILRYLDKENENYAILNNGDLYKLYEGELAVNLISFDLSKIYLKDQQEETLTKLLELLKSL